jgi:hypothetical protein
LETLAASPITASFLSTSTSSCLRITLSMFKGLQETFVLWNMMNLRYLEFPITFSPVPPLEVMA